MRRAERTLVALLLVTLAAGVEALPPEVRQRVDTLPPTARESLQTRQALLGAMTPAQRQAFAQRVAAWDALPIAARRERRERWQAWQALPLTEKLQVRNAAAAFVALPPDQQVALRRQFEQGDGSERRGWLLGPELGAEYPRLQPLLAQVPATQREPLLTMLQAMTAGERLDLAVLVQRTAPQQRDELRRSLLSTSTANRGAWLRLRLDQ